MTTRKPDLFVVGAMKCATSTICVYLENHPDIYFLKNTDPHFFSQSTNIDEEMPGYLDLFKEAGDEKYVGEGSNSYSNIDLYPHSAERIAAFNPNAKIIYSVRNPIDRLISAWGQLRAQSPDVFSHDINEAIRDKPERIYNASLYWRQIETYRRHFDDSQIFISFVEELQSEPEKTLGELSEFLGVPYNPPQSADELWKNKTGNREVMDGRYTLLRKVPGFGFLKNLAPKGLKKSLKSQFSQPTPSKEEMRAQLKLSREQDAALRQEALRILDFAGKPADYWTL